MGNRHRGHEHANHLIDQVFFFRILISDQLEVSSFERILLVDSSKLDGKNVYNFQIYILLIYIAKLSPSSSSSWAELALFSQFTR